MGTIRTPDDLIRGDTVVLFGPKDQLTLTAEQIREQGRSDPDHQPDPLRPSNSRSAWKHCWNKKTKFARPAGEAYAPAQFRPCRKPMNFARGSKPPRDFSKISCQNSR